MIDIKNKLLTDRYICNVLKINNANNKTLDKIAYMLDNGQNFLQFKQGTSSLSDYFEILLKIRQLCPIYNAILIVEDRIDIAKMIGADGIFISNNSIKYKFLSKIIDDDMIIGSDIINSDFSNYVISDVNVENKLTYVINNDKAKYQAIYEVL